MNLSDLTFRKHSFGFQAEVSFDNGFGLSILPEADGATYEVAVLLNGLLTYDSGITEDVIRHASVDDVDFYAEVTRCL